MADGFLGRWSQRKLAERQGMPLDEPPKATPSPSHLPDAVAHPVPAAAKAPRPPVDHAAGDEPAAPPPPAPTLQDVAALHKDSDFKPFVARTVTPAVRNAAMKKMFSDPHFNVMDGLDTYIDDYSLPDPLPESLLRKMASAKFLQLFDDDDAADKQQGTAATPSGATATVVPREDADTGTADPVAQSSHASDADAGATPPSATGPTGTHDDDPDLRLQPDDAAGPAQPRRGTE
jgi:hypothetical protein